jgi:phosphoesterase RecJ-like protein
MITDNIINTLKYAEDIAILPHISADGDALGSSLALGLALNKIGKEVVVYLEEEVPNIYRFLPGLQLIRIYNFETQGSFRKKHDVIVAIDTGDMDRLGARTDIFNGGRITVNIDHHFTNSEFAFLNLVKSSASAVGEIIYEIIRNMNISLDADISTCLYVAIITDTGGFRFSNTTALTHKISAELIDNGVKAADISQQVFETTSLAKVKLMGAAINCLDLLQNGKIAFIVLTDEAENIKDLKDEDFDGIVNIGRNIAGVEVAVLMREKATGEIKVNLRSKSYVDVGAIAGMFSGGGHKRAAGFTTNKNLEELKKMLLKDISESLI